MKTELVKRRVKTITVLVYVLGSAHGNHLLKHQQSRLG